VADAGEGPAFRLPMSTESHAGSHITVTCAVSTRGPVTGFAGGTAGGALALGVLTVFGVSAGSGSAAGAEVAGSADAIAGATGTAAALDVSSPSGRRAQSDTATAAAVATAINAAPSTRTTSARLEERGGIASTDGGSGAGSGAVIAIIGAGSSESVRSSSSVANIGSGVRTRRTDSMTVRSSSTIERGGAT
jgi:hypothetical protein